MFEERYVLSPSDEVMRGLIGRRVDAQEETTSPYPETLACVFEKIWEAVKDAEQKAVSRHIDLLERNRRECQRELDALYEFDKAVFRMQRRLSELYDNTPGVSCHYSCPKAEVYRRSLMNNLWDLVDLTSQKREDIKQKYDQRISQFEESYEEQRRSQTVLRDIVLRAADDLKVQVDLKDGIWQYIKVDEGKDNDKGKAGKGDNNDEDESDAERKRFYDRLYHGTDQEDSYQGVYQDEEVDQEEGEDENEEDDKDGNEEEEKDEDEEEEKDEDEDDDVYAAEHKKNADEPAHLRKILWHLEDLARRKKKDIENTQNQRTSQTEELYEEQKCELTSLHNFWTRVAEILKTQLSLEGEAEQQNEEKEMSKKNDTKKLYNRLFYDIDLKKDAQEANHHATDDEDMKEAGFVHSPNDVHGQWHTYNSRVHRYRYQRKPARKYVDRDAAQGQTVTYGEAREFESESYPYAGDYHENFRNISRDWYERKRFPSTRKKPKKSRR